MKKNLTFVKSYCVREMFDYIEETLREMNLENPNSGSTEEIKRRLAYCEDKVHNIKRIKKVPGKNTFGCIEARENLGDPGILLTIVDCLGRKEMFIKINNHQTTEVLLTKACERFEKNPKDHNLVYNNSTLHKHYSGEIIFERFGKPNVKVSHPSIVFLFPKNS